MDRSTTQELLDARGVPWTGLSATEVHCWSWPVDDATGTDESASWLSAEECARASTFHHERDRIAYTQSHTGLRQLLSLCLDVPPQMIRFTRQAFGKPGLADFPGLQFNLSHTSHYAFCGITRRGAIGVDLERRRELPDLIGMLRAICTPAELATVAGLARVAQQEAFFRLWVRKEACLKASGQGLHVSPELCQVGAECWQPDGWHLLAGTESSAPSWLASQCLAPAEHLAAIVVTPVAGTPPPPRVFSLPPGWSSRGCHRGRR